MYHIIIGIEKIVISTEYFGQMSIHLMDIS